MSVSGIFYTLNLRYVRFLLRHFSSAVSTSSQISIVIRLILLVHIIKERNTCNLFIYFIEAYLFIIFTYTLILLLLFLFVFIFVLILLISQEEKSP